MINGHIYEKSIDYKKIEYLCMSRLQELDPKKQPKQKIRTEKALNKIKIMSELFKYIGKTKQFNLNENSNDPREVQHDKKIKEIIESIMRIPEVKKEGKYLIFAALSMIVQEMIPQFVGKIQIEDLFNTTKLEDNIQNEEVLGQREIYYIRKNKPVINTIKYDKNMKTNNDLKNKY